MHTLSLTRLEGEIMNINQYKDYLSSHGKTMGQVKRNQSDVLMNSTFTIDPAYKKVYILTKDGEKNYFINAHGHCSSSFDYIT